MKLVRMRTLGMFGIGFLAGSRAGRGPWEKAQETMGQLKEKVNNGDISVPSMSSQDGVQSPRGNTPTAHLSEM